MPFGRKSQENLHAPQTEIDLEDADPDAVEDAPNDEGDEDSDDQMEIDENENVQLDYGEAEVADTLIRLKFDI